MRALPIASLLLAVLGLTVATEAGQERPSGRPNIVLIMADDMGYSDLGCYGSEIATPNLDTLAAGGLRFTQFYNTARCCPTRAALLTGLYQHQAGIGHMVGNRGLPAYQGYLNRRCATIAEALRAGGYHTYMAGKWHVGEMRPHWPTDRGFERYFGLISGGSNYFRLDPGRKMARDDQPYVPQGDGFYMTDAFSDAAVSFIERHGRSEAPFFLYVAYTAPHWPLHAWPEGIARYRGKYMDGWDALRERRHRRMIEMGIVEPSWPLTPRDPAAPAWTDVRDKQARDLKMAVYAAQIDRMDQGVGKIVDAIERIGARQNTLIMFLSDNGGCAEEVDRGTPGVPPGPKESFLSYGLPWANASNTPFRLYKHWVHEGGIATPLIVSWPATITTGGRLTGQPGHVIDIMATCLDVAGVPYPEAHEGKPLHPLEGKSLLPVFQGRLRQEHEAIYWEHEGNRAVRQGKFKLVSRHPGKWELYDLQADRTELNNLAGKYPDKVEQLAGLYDRWAKRCGVVPWKELTNRQKGPKAQVVSAQKIWDRARHNAFTDLTRFEDRWYCTFREADTHAAGEDGKLRVLVSTDGEKWMSAALLAEEGVDLRDPKLSVTPDGQLMLVAGGSIYEGKEFITCRPRVAFSSNGCDWTPTQAILAEDHCLWRVTWFKGRAYGVSYLARGAPHRRAFLYSSTDGLNWDWMTRLDVPGVSETTLRFCPDSEMIALVRRETDSKHAWIGTSRPPYKKWQWHETKYRVGGPNFIRLPDGRLWAGGRRYDDPAGQKTVLAGMTRTSYEPVLTLPSGGDTSYPGMVWHDNLLWMTYYSSHEGKAAIYLAKIRLTS